MDRYRVTIKVKKTGRIVTEELVASDERQARQQGITSLRWGEQCAEHELQVVSIQRLTNTHKRRLEGR